VNKTSSVRILLAAAALALGCATASAQEAPAPVEPAPVEKPDRAERIRRARERWAALSPEERESLRRRYEKWRSLPSEEKDDLRRRFDSIGGREGADVVRRRMADLHRNSPEEIERIRGQAAALDRFWARFAEKLPPKAAERFAALSPEAKEQVRRRVSRAYLAAGREAVLARFATDGERAAIGGTDPEARRAALAAVTARRREEVLRGRKEELEKLPAAERRVAAIRMLEEQFWAGAREKVRDRQDLIEAALEKGPGEKASGERNWFEREFGITPEALGGRRAAKPLLFALHARAPRSRPAFLAEVRPELQRIAALPLEQREEALKALLDRIR
jgi:hypothetical protein